MYSSKLSLISTFINNNFSNAEAIINYYKDWLSPDEHKFLIDTWL